LIPTVDRNIVNNKNSWVISLKLVHTGNLHFLAIFYNLAANEMNLKIRIQVNYINILLLLLRSSHV